MFVDGVELRYRVWVLKGDHPVGCWWNKFLEKRNCTRVL